jgi:type IV pilus assembly protein PilV
MSIRKQTGFTLIEVLIAVVIFGVGLLTVASLQIVARQANYDAVQRTTATHLAQGMLERMRANRPALGTYTGGGERVLVGDMNPPGSDCVNTAPCLADELALADLWEWEQLLIGGYEVANNSAVGGLVLPTACIRGPIGAGTYEVAIAWRSPTEQGVPDDACGAGNTAAYGASSEFRRVITVQTFINAP